MSDTTLTTNTPISENGAKAASNRHSFKRISAIERGLLSELQKDFAMKVQARIGAEEMKKLADAIKKEESLFELSFAGVPNRPSLTDLTSAARLASKQQLSRTLKSARMIRQLNLSHITELHNSITHPRIFDGIFNTDLEVATDDFIEYDEYEPPLDFKDVAADSNYNYDGSYAIHQWGIFGNDVDFSHSHSHGDVLDDDASQKYAFTHAGVGKNYTMPRNGALAISMVVRNLSNAIRYSISDHLGPSDAYFDLENILFASIEAPNGGHLHATHVIDQTIRSDGDDKSGKINCIQQGSQLIINFQTDDQFAQGDNIRILITSYLRAVTHVYLMRTDVTATVNWRLEKLYVRIV